MSEVVLHLLLFGGVILVVTLALSPLESLGWWAGWLGPHDEPDTPDPAERAAGPSGPQPAYYVVFLSGIGSISGDELLPTEDAFLDRVAEALPEARIVRDVFPYAPSGQSLLTGQRTFAWLWRRVDAWRLAGDRLLPAILNIRNLFQVLVSADHRYGPLYSFGIAKVARQRLEAHGYPVGGGIPVILLGFSGGGQISVGAAAYLAPGIAAPLGVVTCGGVMASDRGIEAVVRLASLYGAKDPVYRLGRRVFPGRWPVSAASFWNEAAREHRLTERLIGPMKHSGKGGYLDGAPRPDGGAPFLEVTTREAVAAIRVVAGALAQASGRSTLRPSIS